MGMSGFALFGLRDHAKEALGAFLLRVAEDLVGWPLLDDQAVVHEDDAVGDVAGEADLVGHDDHGHAGFGKAADDGQHIADQFRVEGGGRFIEQHQAGRDGQRAGDGDALLLPAGEAVRQVIGVIAEADAGQGLRMRFLSPAAP